MQISYIVILILKNAFKLQTEQLFGIWCCLSPTSKVVLPSFTIPKIRTIRLQGSSPEMAPPTLLWSGSFYIIFSWCFY